MGTADCWLPRKLLARKGEGNIGSVCDFLDTRAKRVLDRLPCSGRWRKYENYSRGSCCADDGCTGDSGGPRGGGDCRGRYLHYGCGREGIRRLDMAGWRDQCREYRRDRYGGGHREAEA